VPLDKGMQLQQKGPGSNAKWLWEGDESGLSSDLRRRIEEQKKDDDGAAAEPPASDDDLRDLSAPIRSNGASRSTGSEMRERCVYELALKKVIAEEPNSTPCVAHAMVADCRRSRPCMS
jgi:hypothetical protein